MEFVGIEANKVDVARNLVVQRIAVERTDRHAGFFASPAQGLAFGAGVGLNEDCESIAFCYTRLDPLRVLGG